MNAGLTALGLRRPLEIGEAAGNISQIDGLRGIAVLSVVLYHFAPASITGGFVGVDIFFVVSGFLIGGILWRELVSTGGIKIGAFLVRRMKRLAPAYFVMAATTTVIAYFILLPFEFRAFGKSLIASVVYLSNVQFFREAGYFDTGSDSKILLHTWSLSVEEQFYLAFPLMLLLLRRQRALLIAALATLFGASLIACIATTPLSPTATFYLFPFRAWELLMGVLLAVAWSEQKMTGEYGPLVSIAGISCILASILWMRPGDGFPGYQALLPTLGTLLLIANIRDRNPVNMLLGAQPLVYLGLISYSLYLWHWPVLTLSSYYLDDSASAAEMGSWLTVAFILATLSWRFVERPVRNAKHLSPFRLLTGVALASLLLVAGGGGAYVTNGMPERFGPDVRMHIAASVDFLQDWSRCAVRDSGPFKGIEVCPVGAPGTPSFVVWGDSHVRAFKEGIDRAAQEQGTAGLLIWRAGCPPLFGVEKRESAATEIENADCSEANAIIRQALPQLTGIKKILLIGRWAYYADGSGIGDDAANTIVLQAAGRQTGTDQGRIFSNAVIETVEELSRHFPSVYVLQQVPEIPRYDSRSVARRLAHGADPAKEAERFIVSRDEVAERERVAEDAFDGLAQDKRLLWLTSRDRFCSETICSSVHGGRSFYFDNNHLTNSAAIAVRDIFLPVVGSDSQQPASTVASLHER